MKTTTDPLAAGSVSASADYQDFIALMSAHQTQCVRSASNQVKLDLALQVAAEEIRMEIGEADDAQKSLALRIEQMVNAHPEWMAGAKSLKTPFGTVKFTRGTALVPLNEELSRLLIEDKLEPHEAEVFIRRKEELDLEALSKLDDATLKTLKIDRVETTYFKIDPARVDLGKVAKRKEVAA